MHTNVTFYGDCLKICEDFSPSFGDKRTGCCISRFLFHQGIFDEKQHDCRPLSAILVSVSSIEDKTERPYF
jgi:hypothetical protein